MAYQKLQVSRAILVPTSDTVNLPNPSAGLQSGAATATTANKLVFATGAFTTTVQVGFIVINTTDNTTAYVTAVDSDTTLSLSVDIMANTENFVIYGEAVTDGAVLYVGGAGAVRVLTSGKDDVTFAAVNAGTFLPVNVIRVYNTTTTATSILALW